MCDYLALSLFNTLVMRLFSLSISPPRDSDILSNFFTARTCVARCIVSAANRREYLVERCLRKAIVSAQISNAVFKYSALLSALLDFNTDIKISFRGFYPPSFEGG